MQKKLIILLFLPLLMFGLCTQVCAAEKVTPDKFCSITFMMEFNDKPLEGGSLSLYRVDQLSDDCDSFDIIEPLRQEGLNLEDLQDPELAENLNKLALDQGLTPFTASVTRGKAVFTDLKAGVYVVSQALGEEIPGYASINPFLISLPQWQNDTYVYDLVASPKVPLVPSSTEPTNSLITEPSVPDTTEPHDKPWLPQTGQLNWPVPIMAVAGLAVFGVGCKFFFGSKRRGI